MLRTISKIKYTVASDRGTNGSSSNGYWDCSKRDKAVLEAQNKLEAAQANLESAIQFKSNIWDESSEISGLKYEYNAIYESISKSAPSLLTDKNIEGLNVGSSCLNRYMENLSLLSDKADEVIKKYEREVKLAEVKLRAAEKIPCEWVSRIVK